MKHFVDGDNDPMKYVYVLDLAAICIGSKGAIPATRLTVGPAWVASKCFDVFEALTLNNFNGG